MTPFSSLSQNEPKEICIDFYCFRGHVEDVTDILLKVRGDDSVGYMIKSMKTLGDYLPSYSSTELLNSPSISFESLRALERAEKLIQETNKKIIETKYQLSSLDLSVNRCSTATLDENDIYIRDLVNATLCKANGHEISVKINYSPSHAFSTKSRRIFTRECDRDVHNNVFEINNIQLNPSDVEKDLKVDGKVRLSMKNLDKLDLYPTSSCVQVSIQNKTEDTIINDPQTNLNASSIDPLCTANLEENVLNSTLNDANDTKILQNLNNKEIDENISDVQNIKSKKSSFLHFLSHMTQLEINKRENGKADRCIMSPKHLFTSDNESLCTYNIEELILTPPNIVTFDKLLLNFDERMSAIIKSINELKFLCFTDVVDNQITDQDQLKLSSLKDTESKTSQPQYKKKSNPKFKNSVQFIFKPKSNMSSSESVDSSESFQPPKKFSTPLIDYKNSHINSDEHNAQISKKYSSINLNSTDNQPKIYPTMYKSSSMSFNKKTEQAKDLHINDNQLIDVEKQNITSADTTLPSYSNDTIYKLFERYHEKNYNPHIVQQTSDQEINFIKNAVEANLNNTANIDIIEENLEKLHFSHKSIEFKRDEFSTNCLKLNKDDPNDINRQNSTHDSSIHDRTSLDISAIYSEIFEELFSESDNSLLNTNDNSEKSTMCKKSDSNATNNLQLFNTDSDSVKENAISTNSISKENSLPQLSKKSLSSLTSLIKSKRTNHRTIEDYSEGEVYLPSSCSYSLGEVRMNDNCSPQAMINKYYRSSSSIHANVALSIGEVLGTKVESSLSLPSRGTV